MNSCRRIQQLIARREAGLSEAEALTLELHLNDCESCRAEAAAFDSLGALYSDGGQALSERTRRRAVAGALASRQTEAGEPVRRASRWVVPGLAVGAAAAALALTWSFAGPSSPAPGVDRVDRGPAGQIAQEAQAPGATSGAASGPGSTAAAAPAASDDRILEGDIRVDGQPVAPGTRLAGLGLSTRDGGDKVAGLGLSTRGGSGDSNEASGGDKVAGLGLSTRGGSGDSNEASDGDKVAGLGLSTRGGSGDSNEASDGDKVAGIGLSTRGGSGDSNEASDGDKVAGIGLSTRDGARVAGIGLSTIDGGAVALANGTVVLEPRTSVVWRPAERILSLREGAVQASVDGPGAETFRVATSRFVVEVVGTEFEVNETGVSVKEGIVRVLAPGDGRELATVKAGARWELEDEPGSDEVASTVAGGEAQRDGSAASGDDRPARTSTPRPTDIAAALDRARGQIASGGARSARQQLRRLLAAELLRRQRAEAETLLAECDLVEGDRRSAARRYRRVASRYADLAAGETALFAAAQTFASAGADDKAQALYRRYVRRYPRGRFITQVRERLARDGASKREPR